MPTEGSITRRIHEIEDGDPLGRAVRDLWDRFYGELTRHALRKLKSMHASCQVADEEDAANQAFRKVLRGIESGKLKLRGRNDLRRLLLFQAAREAITLYRREQRRRGQIPLNPDIEVRKAVTAMLQAIEEEVVRSFLDSLNDELRQITEWRLMGHTNQEIAQKLGCSRATVERKFQRVRDKWRGRCELPPERQDL